MIHSAAMISINMGRGAVNNTNVEGTRNLYDTALEVDCQTCYSYLFYPCLSANTYT
ncbi:MAG: hypothetical protein LC127_13045 [Chitinophagales bacterium]|nr:hypothetical protein [Chitinophagales bacterium]